MEALLGTVEEETALVRAGKLAEAAKLEAAKTELSGMYVADTARIGRARSISTGSRRRMAAELRQRHDLFRAVLQMNLTVLATAHAVSESIMRGVSSSSPARPPRRPMAHRAAPPRRRAAAMQPLTFSRVL